MVFESVVVELLNRYLKPYVKKLDTSQLKVAVWKGHASLDKLELKEDLFAEADLDVPLRIKRSFIGKLEMQIPWKRLTKDPLVITIDEIYVILEPNIGAEYDPEKDLEHQRREKEKKIEKFKEKLKEKKKLEKENKKVKKKASESSKPDTFVEKLAVHLTKNLQVVVTNIHVRYEDSITKPGITMSAGATLDSLHLKSTDSNWVPAVVRETATVIYKLVELNCLGVYSNCCDQKMVELPMPTMIEEMKSTIARPGKVLPPCNAYLLSPVTATAKLKMNVKIDGDISMPQLVGGVDCGDIMFSLQQEQLKAVLMTVEQFERFKVNKKYLKYRPSVSVSEDRKAWWRYVITAMLEEEVKRRTRMWAWSHMKRHRDLCVLYQKKYYEKQHSHNVSASLKEELQWLEDRLDWFNIMVYRKAAEKRTKKSVRVTSISQPVMKGDTPPSPLSPSSSVTDESSSRRTLYSVGSKDAKREEKARKEEEKARKEEQKAAARREEKARKEEQKAVQAAAKKEEKTKKEKKTSNRAFFAKLKRKVQGSKRSDVDLEEKESLADASQSTGLSSEGVASDVMIPGENGNVKEESSWELISREEVVISEEEEEKEREQLYKDIGYQEDAEESKYPKDYIGHEFHVKVKSFTLDLFGRASKIGHLETKGIQVDLLHRPATSAISIATAVGSMVMEGLPHSGRTTTLVTSLVGGASNATSQLVDLKLDVNPIDRPEMDITVKAALRPIQITYDFDTVNALVEMFKPPKLIHFQELTQAASASWEQLKSQTSASLKQAVRDRKRVELDITLQSPFLILPEKGLYTDTAHLVVADLGRLSVFGHTTDNKSATIKTRTDALENCYDTFTIKLDGMQVMVAKPGDDWWGALRGPGSSPLHILAPSGFQISLLKSIVENDAYLPSLRVEGAIPGFDVTISDSHLVSLMKVVGSMEKPPALITVTDAYDALPTISHQDSLMAANLTALSLDTVSSSVFGDEEGEEDEEAEEDPTSSVTASSNSLQKPNGGQDDITARHVFTDVSIKLGIERVSLKLTQEQRAKKKLLQIKPLLEVVVMSIKAEVTDRKWDTQGSVSLKSVAILDHITTTGKDKAPSYLLKTEALTDGNFMSARFVMITQLGADFAAKYTGLQDTVSAQLSLVKIDLHQETLAALVQYGMKLLSAMKPSADVPEITEETDREESIDVEESVSKEVEVLNPNDIAGNKPRKVIDLHFDAKFEGIDLSMQQAKKKVADINVKGFSMNGRAQTKEISIDVRIEDMSVLDPASLNAPTIVEKADKMKDIVSVKVVQYNHPSYERDPNNLDWVDTSLQAKIGGINVYIHTAFMAKILKFLKDLNFNVEVLQSAALATAETATATASAIVESTKSSHRVRLGVVFHAPKIYLPYYSVTETGHICIDLGDFQVSNKFVRAVAVESAVTETINLRGCRTVMDAMEIKTSRIRIYRNARNINTGAEKCYTILEPLEFLAVIRRNITRPTELYPNVDIGLDIDAIKFHLHENDVQAILSMLVKTVTVLNTVMFPPYAEIQKRRAQTLMPPRAETLGSRPRNKRGSVLFSNTRSRSTTSHSRTLKPTKKKTGTLEKHVTYKGKEVTDVRVSLSLKSVSLEFSTVVSPLFYFSSRGLKTGVSVFKDRVSVSASVDSLSLVDQSSEGNHSKVLSLAEDSHKVSSLDLTVFLDKEVGPLKPMGTITTNIAQLRLIVLTPFIMQIMEFALRLKFDVGVFKNASVMASQMAQEGVAAVSDMAHDKYFSVAVTVHAPVLILPISETSRDGFMVDLGSVAIQNTILVPDQQAKASIDAYGIRLDSFKVSRILLDYSDPSNPVVAERVLLQPFSMLLALERNLCPWYTQVPTLSINVTMGELAVFFGQEDLERIYKFALAAVDQVKPVISKVSESSFNFGGNGGDDDSQSLPAGTLTEEERSSDEASFEKFRILSSLPLFELKLFKGEPSLLSRGNLGTDLKKCEDKALASLKLVHMDMKVIVSSQTEVDVQASMKDISLSNEQPETKKRNTGNRVIQHYTSNPLKAYTGDIPSPIISIQYILRTDKEHIAIVKAQDLLILSDVEFMSSVADYLRAIFDPKKVSQSLVPPPSTTAPSGTAVVEVGEKCLLETEPSPLENTLTTSQRQDGIKKTVGVAEKGKPAASKPLPRVKAQVSISNFRVAIIEDVYTEKPQALTLRVSSHLHVQLSESHKHASVTLSDLGVAASSFYDLDNTTSWVLLPTSMQIAMTGPPDQTAMDISGTVAPICLTLSPPIVRLIIHAIGTLMPTKEAKIEEPPRDLWMKQVLGSKFWFLEQATDLKKALLPSSEPQAKPKGEVLTLSIESVEIILESDFTSNSPGLPVVALNCRAVVQVFEWTGQLSMSGDVHVEATYFNQSLSLWEPLLETVEKKNGRVEQWDVHIKAAKAAASKSLQSSDSDLGPKPDFSVELCSTTPLQVTITKTSLQLIKDLADAYGKDYGKQVEGNVLVQSLTGAPYTVISKLGKGTSLFVQSGSTLKLQGVDKDFAKLDHEETVDLTMIRPVMKRSYTSSMAQYQTEEANIDIAVGSKFRPLKNVAVDSPGLFYYTLIPKEEYEESTPTYGIVVDVAVTGTKKTIIIRSPLQVKNHMDTDLEVLGRAESKSAKERVLVVLKKDETCPLPIDVVERHAFSVRPAGFGFTPVGPTITWHERKDGQHMDLKCMTEDDDSVCFFSRVVFREEAYKSKKNLQKDVDYAHHVFHIYPPLVVQNLLPFKIVVEAMESGCSTMELGTGESKPIYAMDLGKNPEMRVSVIQRKKSVGLKGKFNLDRKMGEYVDFPTTAASGLTPTQLTLHTEDMGYLKVAIYSSIWVINKTGLTLEYKEGNKVTKHPADQDLVLLSTSGKKSKIQLRATTKKKSSTEWTKHFPVNVVGTSGNFCAKLGENTYHFGVEVYLSQFTLTKMVMITPYFLLVNKTKTQLQVYEQFSAGLQTAVPPEKVVPFWTMTNADRLMVVAGKGKEATSVPFLFKKPDNVILQFGNKNEVLALSVEIQETESANIITFSPYYHGCIPLLVINHFPDLSLRFTQSHKTPVVCALSARESLYYTWDDPQAKKVIKWDFPSAKVHNRKPVDVSKDGEGKFSMNFEQDSPRLAVDVASSIAQQNAKQDQWVDVDESFAEQLVVGGDDDDNSSTTGSVNSDLSSLMKGSSASASAFGNGNYKGYWKSFTDGIQRVLLFTPDEEVIYRIRSANTFSLPKVEVSLSLKAVGLSLVDNKRKQELAYISVQPSCVIWQLDKGKKKRVWKTLQTSVIAILEQAYQEKRNDVKVKDLAVNLISMEMYSPLKGKLRRTNYEGVNVKFAMSESDFSLQAKIGHVQIDNQLPFAVYPQMLYPLPPPPTVVSTTEPKPFVEASIILRKKDQSNVTHFKYVHVLVQKMSVNADLGFILSLVDFFSLSEQDAQLEKEYVQDDVKYASKSLKETVVPELASDISVIRLFFDVLHLAPIKINLSFNVRGVGKNKGSSDVAVGDRFLHLFLDSIGVILTSVQDIEMKFSLFHLEFQPQTVKGVGNLLIKHYRTQALFELYTLIFGLDVLGNPVSVVRGVVIGAKDLFYEPFKGSVLGPEEFFQGLGLGLRSFFGAGVVGGLTGAGARITGAFGDVFAKLSFDEEFIDQRQQAKTKPPKMGWKLGNFAKNMMEGVTGVVTQPVKGAQKEGAVGLLKGTGKGLVGLLVRPAGGIVDLASGTLEFVTRKTKVGNIEISDVRPPRYIGRDGMIRPYSLTKAEGTALFVSVDEGAFVETDYYTSHVQIQLKPPHFLVVTDRRALLIERKVLTEGWKSFQEISFQAFEFPVEVKDLTVIIKYSKEHQNKPFKTMSFRQENIAQEVGRLINHSYDDYLKD